ncbi:MAG TPA: flagellar motor switch protein FliN [Myxococcales bacterium]|nr:flagellar motor switch protein FliN [Myxococcales bacterium]
MSLDPPHPSEASSRRLDLLLDVPLDVTVELGRARMSIHDLLSLSPGSVIELDKMAGEPLDIVVNGRLIARGEAVVVNDRFGIRITDIVSKSERIARLR